MYVLVCARADEVACALRSRGWLYTLGHKNIKDSSADETGIKIKQII